MISLVRARAAATARNSSPFIITIFLLTISILPMDITGLSIFGLVLVLNTVFYWSIYRPEIFPTGLVFLTGIYHDFLTGGPLGSLAIGLMLLHGLVLTQRRALADKSHWIIWLAYLPIALLAMAGYWLTLCLFHWRLMDPGMPLLIWLMSALTYPLLAECLTRLRARILKI